MTPQIPALNEVTRQALDEEPEYDDGDRMYLILFDEDYHGHGSDLAGNVALLLDREQAVEVRDLAQEIVDELDGETPESQDTETDRSGGGADVE